MAATNLAAILAAWATLVEAAPLSLVPAIGPFTHDLQPAGMVANSYYLMDGGAVARTTITNDHEVRKDRIQVWIAKPLNFAPKTQLTAMETLADDLYRHLIVTARAAGYNVEPDTRRITRPANTDLLIASIDFVVDYDFRTSVS